MGELTDAFTAALVGRGEDVEADPGDVFDTGLSNAALVRAMHDIEPGARLPAKGTDARREYDADLRRVQRYRAGEGKQQRGRARPDPRFMRAAKRAPAKRKRAAGRRGVDVRVRAPLKVSAVWRTHTMPASGAVHVELDSDVLDAWAAGDDIDAELADAFLDAYGLPDAELGDVEWTTMEVP